MDFRDFERRADDIFREIPEEFKHGIDGLRVVRRAEMHPELPGIYTLGECRSEFYLSDFGGPGDVHSLVYLYYGSFLELARRSDDWDWEGELWETITHEVRHHLESLASDDALEVQDYAEDQNFARREGRPFDPFFFQHGDRLDERTFYVDGDTFLEIDLNRTKSSLGDTVQIGADGWPDKIAIPVDMGDVHFLTLQDLEEHRGDRVLVIINQKGIVGLIRRALTGRAMEVTHSTHSLIEEK